LSTTPTRLRDLTRNQRLLLAGLVALGVALRVFFHIGRPFDGDEIGSLIYIKKSFGFLLTHFIDPWLTMNWYLAFLKGVADASGTSHFAMALPSQLADACSIVLVAALALRVSSPRTALAAAALYALNPYLIGFAGIIRAYSLMLAFALAALVYAYDWHDRPSVRAGIGVSLFSLLALLAQPIAIWVLLFAGLVLVARIIRTARTSLRESATVAVPGIVAAAAAAFAYHPFAQPMAAYAVGYTYVPPTQVNYLPSIATEYFAAGYFVIPSLAVLAAGCICAARWNTRLLALSGLIPWCILGSSLQGTSLWPWAMSRYHIALVPILLILMAEALAKLGPSWRRTALGVTLVAATWIPEAKTKYENRAQFPVDDLVAHLQAELTDSDTLVAADSSALLRLLDAFDGKWQWLYAYAGRSDEDASERLVLVSSFEPLLTDAKQARFGDFQVTAYMDDGRAARLRHIYRDLQRTTAGRTQANLAQYYEQMLSMQRAVAPGDDRAELTRLYYECAERTRRGRNPLPQRLGIPYDERR
jgi:hypothetical protein